MRERLRAEVQGRVQGVGFRYFVQGWAARLRLAGYARNLPNGRLVEVVAEGDRAALQQLLAALQEGPPGSHVERVGTSWGPASGEFGGFAIRH
jgi:acylphosphatase